MDEETLRLALGDFDERIRKLERLAHEPVDFHKLATKLQQKIDSQDRQIEALKVRLRGFRVQ